ncbi:Tfp pilus assembly protein tip-associated adhesin PilY1-like [Stutzerimonas stutzeri ATCC 14405 = CCUG 16156]|uniref:PilC/PilY family type IV pilus protein n=1 Tax=Stutzerimonas stutzeri TaxID=316 RepID=UPI0002548E5D|nr:PilC/PilY family type IV pilus protein [Stutzerimonas stutzeri]EHY76884.1 Tfp pilus assembly protein tip-associated adhesin PilY1-like [Stutzerimonas stutzeri ATCC 14405 = CCUG 16156]
MNIRPYALLLGSFCYIGLSLQTALADDTEIYVSRKLSEDQQIRPNLLFVIDNSGSMLSAVPGTKCADGDRDYPNRCDRRTNQKTRMQVVKDVTNELIDELRLSDDVNVGLMHFDTAVRYSGRNIDYSKSYQGGMVAIPVGRISSNADALKEEINKLYALTNTPLSETYYEAALYMRGEQPKFGDDTQAGYEDGKGSKRENKPSVPGSKNGDRYKSPIEYSCQKSNIILLTDGEPTYDNAANNDIRSLISTPGETNTQYLPATCRNPGTSSTSRSGECMPHLAEHLANQDISSSQPGKQTVNTYTIGFATNQTLLQNTANAGNGRYFTTDNTSGLVDALKSILVEILAENTTFATPSVAVSAYNNLGYRNDLYYALFRPAEGARWVGNVKRYRAETTTDANGNTITQVVDKNGQPAIDESTGFFRDNSSSFWSSLDGRDVEKGGVAGTLNEPANRKIFTWTAADRSPSASTGSEALSSQLNENNSALTQALLGVNSSEARTKAIQWGRGQNPDSPAQARRQLADVLHNEPRLAAYKTDEDLERAGTATSPEQLYMFFGTNEGFIHAVDPSNGQEKFAFIPKELLPNLSAYYQNPKGSDQKRYGMDGQFNLWVEYGDLDINAKTRSISKSYLYAGMRRGGKNYYALDVTNIDQPKLKWVIKGGATPGFEKLGQTWSTPKLANIKLNGTQTKVLVFTGGYDPQQDNDSPNTPLAGDTQGNALYIVNAETGQLIWRAGHSSETGANLKLAEMTHSMPADPVIIDANGDGLADIIYAVDARAQVFRFDIDNASSSASALATGGRIAKLGGDTALDNRRFFSMPDVAMVRERGGKSYFAIAIGSGYRSHPLNEDTIDRFYVLQDGPLFSKPKDGIYTTLTEDDLLDVSSVDLTDAEAAGIQEEIAEAEAAIAALNQAVAAARDAFNAYKESSGFTSKYNAMLQANNAANSLQAEIDALMASDPYLQAHAAESSEQSKLQQGLLESQNTLKALQDAIAAAAPDLADKEDAYEAAKAHLATIDEDDPTYADAKQAYESAKGDWDAADGKQTARSEQRTKLAEIYSTLISLQAELNSAYQGILDQERAILDAVAASASESTVDNLRSGLETLNQDYGNHPAALKRDGLNAAEGSSTQLLSALNRLKDAIHRDAASQIDGVLADLSTQLSPLAPSLVESELLAREEAAKHTELAAKAANLEGNVDFAAELESQRLAQSGQASAAQAEANDIASGPYQASSALLNAEQLAAAKALYGNDLTMFEAYQFLLDQAQLAVTDSEDGVPALRKEINQLYGQLVPGNSYTPNPSLLAGSKGWFMRLPKGEKVLSSPLIFRGALFFTTFSPRGETITTCGPDVGRGRAYALNLRDASAILAVNDAPIRSYALLRSGIPPAPTVLFNEDGPPRVIIGTEVLNDRPKDGDGDEPECIGGVGFCDKDRSPVSKTYWREN